eukprot:COSAG02_NODE_59_length_43585_cov_39.087752_21_plen_168_part_00
MGVWSLQIEASKIRVSSQAGWGVDWVKVDNCEYGSWADLIASQRVMSKAIQATGRPMIIQVGAGDHMPLLNNPNASLSDSYARTFEEEAWIWGPEVAHTWYTGNDKQNSWKSTIHNVLQNYRGAETFQKPGAWNFAGDLWWCVHTNDCFPPLMLTSEAMSDQYTILQ